MYLQSVINFQVTLHCIQIFSGWVLLLDFIKNSILNGSKEVALAAINCLQTFVGANCPKVLSLATLTQQSLSKIVNLYIFILSDRSYLVCPAGLLALFTIEVCAYLLIVRENSSHAMPVSLHVPLFFLFLKKSA